MRRSFYNQGVNLDEIFPGGALLQDIPHVCMVCLGQIALWHHLIGDGVLVCVIVNYVCW